MRIRSRLLPILLLPFVISVGCRSITEQMSPDADAQIPTADGSFKHADSTLGRLDNSEWWTLFNDPTLNQLITNLNAANPDAEAALARIDQSFAAMGITRVTRNLKWLDLLS